MNGRSEKRTDCENCPLRRLAHFRAFTSDELAYVSRFKVGEFAVDAGATILMEGAQSAHLFTVLSGWGFRYKTLDDGRRQILNYVMPGDLVGLQGSLLGEMQHSIEALSPSPFASSSGPSSTSSTRATPNLPTTSPGSRRARSASSTRTC